MQPTGWVKVETIHSTLSRGHKTDKLGPLFMGSQLTVVAVEEAEQGRAGQGRATMPP